MIENRQADRRKETDGQTDLQRDKQTDRQKDRNTDRQKHRNTETQNTDRQAGRQTERKTDRNTYIQTDRRVDTVRKIKRKLEVGKIGARLTDRRMYVPVGKYTVKNYP